MNDAQIVLVVATRNRHKVSEIQSVLGGRFHCVSAKDFQGAPETVEDADTFAGNAIKKAADLACWISGQAYMRIPLGEQTFVLADDSGLQVDALDGAPGVHSARYAAADAGRSGNSPDADNNAKLMRLLQNIPVEKRTARFRCVLALSPALRSAPGQPPAREQIEAGTRLFEGVCEGRMGFSPRGQNGFGYDPLFIPDGFAESFAELGETVKNQLSHRAKALEKLRAALG